MKKKLLPIVVALVLPVAAHSETTNYYNVGSSLKHGEVYLIDPTSIVLESGKRIAWVFEAYRRPRNINEKSQKLAAYDKELLVVNCPAKTMKLERVIYYNSSDGVVDEMDMSMLSPDLPLYPDTLIQMEYDFICSDTHDPLFRVMLKHNETLVKWGQNYFKRGK